MFTCTGAVIGKIHWNESSQFACCTLKIANNTLQSKASLILFSQMAWMISATPSMQSDIMWDLSSQHIEKCPGWLESARLTSIAKYFLWVVISWTNWTIRKKFLSIELHLPGMLLKVHIRMNIRNWEFHPSWTEVPGWLEELQEIFIFGGQVSLNIYFEQLMQGDLAYDCFNVLVNKCAPVIESQYRYGIHSYRFC